MGATRIASVIPAATPPSMSDTALPNGEGPTVHPQCHLRGIGMLAGAIFLFVALAMTHPLTAFAATVTVTTTGDTTNACATSGTGTCSLRDAVTFANNNDSTTIAFNLANPSTIMLTGGTLTLTRTTGSGTTITGPGSAALAVDGNNAVTVFTVNSGVTASISGMTIQHGNAGSGDGGGIANSGTLTVTNSTLFGNKAFLAGGINNDSGGTLVLIGSTIANNTATPNFFSGPGGGGIRNAGTLTVTNSTFTGNTTILFGGGIDNAGTATVTNSTLFGNTSTSNGGGGIDNNDNRTLTITNTIVSGNTGGDLYGTSSGGNNLIGGTALLAPLGNYGGPTQTMALLPGSPAINAGNDSSCAATGTGNVNGLDQRGISRSGNGAHCDIGAFESRGFSIAITGGDPQTGLLSQPFATPLAVSVTSSNSEPVNGGAVTFTVNPVGGAGATLTGNPATIASGAASVTAQANGTAGSYTVTAAASGASSSFTFHLTNVPVALVVNNTGDGAAAVSLNCAAGNASTCRLRDAIALVDAGATSGNTTITFALPTPSTITLDSAQGSLNISASMTITGPGAGKLTISGNNATPVFVVGDVTTISGVTIAGGKSTNPAFSGGITNVGSTLTVTNCTFSGNSAPGGNGGGIANAAPGSTLTVMNSTFSNNSATGGSGGGIFNSTNGTMTVANSTFSGNSATTGGAIASHSLALTVAVTNSTFSGNTASGSGSVGGGIANNGFLTVTNSTFTANTASGSGNAGGGIYNALKNGGALGVTNSTFSGNSATIGGGVANSGLMAVTNSTLVGNTATTGGGISAGGTLDVTNSIVSGNTGGDVSGSPTGSHNLIGGNPLLSTLGNHGGPTQTFALLAGSPAIDAGDDTICQDMHLIAPVAGLDQRGVSRPQGAHCDIGAFEYAVTNTLPGSKTPGGAGGSPGPMPGSRPMGPDGGTAPSPIPVNRP